MKFDEFNIHDFGNTLVLSGMIFSNTDKHYLIPFPEEQIYDFALSEIEFCNFTTDDWVKLLRQTDILETEILASDKNGFIKAIIRKSARQIDQQVSWEVYARDNYTCRYCGRTNIPLTVDHLILWECGGPSIHENLVSACKKCNKSRGNTEYSEWLKSEFYLRVSANLDEETLKMNDELVESIKSIPVKVHKVSRGSKKKH